MPTTTDILSPLACWILLHITSRSCVDINCRIASPAAVPD